jgi:twitching motility protein PilU
VGDVGSATITSNMGTAMLKVLLQRMVISKASDAFITAGAPIYLKVSGEMTPLGKQIMEPHIIREMAYAQLSEQQIRSFEEKPEFNFSIILADVGNFRINMFRQRGTIALAIRYISFGIPTLEELGLPENLSELVMAKRGLILVVGSTGVGKSTTLASMIDHRIGNYSGHLLTLEDPIEYLFKHKKSIVNQRNIGIDTESYKDALHSALRQAPDCLLIGEIRDTTSMQAAINFSLSGHLCLATLHANNSYHALSRIINMFPVDSRQNLLQDLAVSLRSIVAQRLIVDGSGKRVPIIEMLGNTPLIRDLIERGELSLIKEGMEKSMSPDLITFDKALKRLYQAGRISREIALEHADSPTNLSLILDSDRPAPAVRAAGSPSAPVPLPSAAGRQQAPFDDFKLIYGEGAAA